MEHASTIKNEQNAKRREDDLMVLTQPENRLEHSGWGMEHGVSAVYNWQM